MGYNLITRSGHNMFDMASLLQKAIRRGDKDRAGYAANELFGTYYGMLWKRLLTVSAEDCWGILTKEIVALRHTCELKNKDLKGYDRDTQYVSKAVELMCKAKKSRDACYFACNFVLNTEVKNPGELSKKFIQACKEDRKLVQEDVFEMKYILGKLEKGERKEKDGENISIFDFMNNSKDELISQKTIKSDIDFQDFLCGVLRKSIRTLDMEVTGYAIHMLRKYNYSIIWDTLYVMAQEECAEILVGEIIGLKIADKYVNKNNKVEKRDEIYLCKAVMLIMYHISEDFDSLVANNIIKPFTGINWDNFAYKDIRDCKLIDNIIPEWVYDVHTLKGKKQGKTDWDMNLVEQAGLSPMQPAFFEDGDWSPRYEWKWKNGLCTEKEYKAMKEYQKGRKGNPVKKILDKYEI